MLKFYPVTRGTVERYFVDGSAEVQGTGFAVEAAIYQCAWAAVQRGVAADAPIRRPA